MEKAIMTILDEKENIKKRIDVQFNPSDYSTSNVARYSEAKGVAQRKKTQQFISEDNTTLKIKLTLDGFTKAGVLDPEKAADVLEDLMFFKELVSVDASLHKPPLCTFAWGSFSIKGHTEQLSVNYSMFASNGKPIRATVDLSIRGAPDINIAFQSPDRTKRMILTQDTPLYMTAYEAYNDPAEWRRIAVANCIRNPRRLRPGLVLKIPPMEHGAL